MSSVQTGPPNGPDRGQPAVPPDHPGLPARVRRSLGVRFLGWALLVGSVGLVSCQSLFVL
ncbi:MAG: hypothetical protein EA400_17750 [Chromatiaceae bacterium]|nr:MAG: hypothetical protein EA400_17750 [Chromatiaceae bacterium]